MSHESSPLILSLSATALESKPKIEASPGGQEGESPRGWLVSLRKKVALWLYPELGDAYERCEDAEAKAAARGAVIDAYRDMLRECERQRVIDADARHLFLAEAKAYKGKYELLLGDLRRHVKCAQTLGKVLQREGSGKSG